MGAGRFSKGLADFGLPAVLTTPCMATPLVTFSLLPTRAEGGIREEGGRAVVEEWEEVEELKDVGNTVGLTAGSAALLRCCSSSSLLSFSFTSLISSSSLFFLPRSSE